MSNEKSEWTFGHWLRFGAKGSQYTYYEGDLGVDRALWAEGLLGDGEGEHLPLADMAAEAHKAGKVRLAQSRSPDGTRYLAIKV